MLKFLLQQNKTGSVCCLWQFWYILPNIFFPKF